MSFKQKMAVVGGMVVLVGAAYVGVGTVASTQNTAVAQDQMMQAGGAGPDFTRDEARLGYAIGAQIAMQMKQSDMQNHVDIDAIQAAFKDVLTGAELRMTPEDMQQAQVKHQQKMQEEYAALKAKNLELSEAFIAEKGKEKGVVGTDSGLKYKVVREGKGKQPTSSDVVKVHYEGRLADGTKFDSSHDRGAPADFPVSGVIPGFGEGLMTMKEGGKQTLYIPAGLAYGENGPPMIGPNQALVFEVELIEVVSQADATSKKEG